MSSGCALLAGDSHSFVESVGAAVSQLRERLDLLKENKETMPADEAVYLKSRLNGMLRRLSGPITAPIQERADTVAATLRSVAARL